MQSSAQHAKAPAAKAANPNIPAQSLSDKFKIDRRLLSAFDALEPTNKPPDFRTQFLETVRLQRAQPATFHPINDKVDVKQIFAPRVAVGSIRPIDPNMITALNRNYDALAWYRSLHGTLQYKLGESNIRPSGKGDCTSFDEFIAAQFGHTDNTDQRWYTRKMWQTGYQMRAVAAHEILPGDQIVVPPKGRSWPMSSNSEPTGVGHAGVFVIDQGKLKIMHASSKYGTVVLSSPEEFMQDRLGFKIYRPQGQGKFAFRSDARMAQARRV